MGTGDAGEGAGDVFLVGDDRFTAAVVDVVDGGLDFWKHAAGGEMAFGDVLLGFGRGHVVKPVDVGLVEVEGDFFDGRADK